MPYEEKPLEISSRRYIGNKAKLAGWIMDSILSRASAKSFCDLFSGTGVVANAALSHCDRVIMNDFLYSNNVIHKAFFGSESFDKTKLINIINQYNALPDETIGENYFSDNFGGKYFEPHTARRVGYIRQDIADRTDLTRRERDILLATLIYASDRAANTVGHFDAYLKTCHNRAALRLKLINAQITDKVAIHRADANKLVNEIRADIFYIDPPYNSRQYSRFYHVYENLVKWEKPDLYGVALKPKPENMSDYCSTKAIRAFADLIDRIDAKWIAVSYNNTYNSKSGSSRNRMSLDDIGSILETRGAIKVFEKSRAPFDAGKTDFADHREYLFVAKVDKGRKTHAKSI